MELFITPTGQVSCLYGEEMDLSTLGRQTIRRASYVEPTAEGDWTADFSAAERTRARALSTSQRGPGRRRDLDHRELAAVGPMTLSVARCLHSDSSSVTSS